MTRRKAPRWQELSAAVAADPDNMKLREELRQEIIWANTLGRADDRSISPERATRCVEEGLLTEEQAALAVAFHEQAQRNEQFFKREIEARGLSRAGRPPASVNRDALIRCLRDCQELEYYQISAYLARHGLKVCTTQRAWYEARRRGRDLLNGRPCDHRDLKVLGK